MVIGERSEPSVGMWMKNFVLLCMAICGIYIYVPYTHNPESARKILWTQLRKWSCWKICPRYTRFVKDEEDGCRFEGQRKETWIYTLSAWLVVAVGERMLEFYSY